MRVLFLGEGNDCRTLLAEAVFNQTVTNDPERLQRELMRIGCYLP